MKKTSKSTGRKTARGGTKQPAAAGTGRAAKPAAGRAVKRTHGTSAAEGRPAPKAKLQRLPKVQPGLRPDSVTERDRKREATKKTLRAKVRAAGATTLATPDAVSAGSARPAALLPPAAHKPVAAKLPDTPAAALAQRMHKVLDDMQAIDPVIIPVGDRTPMADYFLIAGGKSITHTRALFNALYRAMKDEHTQLRHSEGQNAALWILADYGAVVAHLFEQETRGKYALEELWLATKHIQEEDLL